MVENLPRSINGYGSGRQWVFDGNQVVGPKIVEPSNTFNIGGSIASLMTGLQITNNSIQLLDSSAYPNGISLSYTQGAIVRGNTVYGVTGPTNGGAAVALRTGAVNSDVSQNSVNSQNLKFGVLLQSGASGSTIHDNQFVSNAIGIYVLTGATNTNIGCNSYVSNLMNNSDFGSGTLFTCGSH